MMEKINDLGHLSALISSYFKKGVLTNSFSMPGDYKRYIEEGLLYYNKLGSGIILLRHAGSHWRVYYYLNSLHQHSPLPQDKPSAMEIVFSPNSEAERILSFWQDAGFNPYLFRKRMTVPSLAFQAVHPDTAEAGFAQVEHASAILELMENSFDKYLGCIPALNEIAERIQKQELICAWAPDGKIAGVLEIGRKRNTYSVWHIVVAPQFRRSGLAKKMLAYFNSHMVKDEKMKIELWVQEQNDSARRLYEDVGFQYDGWESVGLLYQPPM